MRCSSVYPVIGSAPSQGAQMHFGRQDSKNDDKRFGYSIRFSLLF